MLTVKIVHSDRGNPPGKLADAELYFTDGPLAGLKLIGFAIWERRSGTGRNVTFPARQYSVNGERRSFALLRPVTDATGQERLRDLILQAYAEHEAGDAADAVLTRAKTTARETPAPVTTPTPAPTPAPARTPTAAPFRWADADPESYAGHAAEMLDSMTPDERHGVSFGLFPADAMRRAETDGYRDSQRLAVALMDAAKAHAAKTPAPTATPAPAPIDWTRKEKQEWELAGLASQDRDKIAAERHTARAQSYARHENPDATPEPTATPARPRRAPVEF